MAEQVTERERRTADKIAECIEDQAARQLDAKRLRDKHRAHERETAYRHALQIILGAMPDVDQFLAQRRQVH